jgi:enoyl-CoA hydratase
VIGRYRAFDLLFTGRSFSAGEALGLGLVSRCAPAGGAREEAMAAARVIAAKSPAAVRASRAAFHREADRGYAEAVARAVDDFCALAVSADAQEGLRAFLDKRSPEWGAE